MALEKISTLGVEVIICGGHDIHTRHRITPTIKKIHYRVDIRIGDMRDKTDVARVSAAAFPKWDHKIMYHVSKEQRLFLELYCLHKCRKTHRVGISTEIDILSLRPFDSHQIQLYNKRGIECGTISLWYQIPREAHDPNDADHATRPYSLERLRSLGITIDAIESTKVQLMSPAWTNLLFSLGSIVQLVKNIAQLHPKAHLAVTAATLAFQIALSQCQRDEKVNDLVDMMAGNYRLITDSRPLEAIQSCRMTIERLLDTTSECAIFIADYYNVKNFAMRTVNSIASRTDVVIESFEKTFANLRIEFVTNASAQTAIQTIRILEGVEAIAKDVQDINASINLPMHETSWDPQGVCLPGSQKVILDEIARWAISRAPEAPIFLLTGPAGCGKTCIANSIAVTFDNGRRLGASVFLDRSIDEHMNPSRIFSSIARELAAFDDKLKLRISKAISHQPSLSTAVLERQLQGLIVEPLSGLTIIGPILVIIDGLDVWQDRHRVLSALRNATNIPENLRILITARQEDDIVNSLIGVDHCYQRHMTVDEEGLVHDVATYSRQCLKTLQDLRPSIFADSSLEEVLDDFEMKSRGIYLWVSVAIRFLAIVSDDTARAFLSNICSTGVPRDYTAAMTFMEESINDALMATSRVKLRSRLSVGAAMALGVVGLRSDKMAKVMDAMIDKRLFKHNDNAGRFFSSLWHPSLPDTNVTAMAQNVRCPHGAIERGSNTPNTCMACACIGFLCDRLSSDVCSRTYQTKHKGETMLDVRLRQEAPEYLRPYINEAYQYATSFWVEHLGDVQGNGDSALLKHKLVDFSKHFLHLFEFMDKNEQKMTRMLDEFLAMVEGTKLYDLTIASHTKTLLAKLQLPHVGNINDLTRRKSTNEVKRRQSIIDRSPSEDCCVCPWYRAWKITSTDMCSLRASLEYACTPNPFLQCLMVTPPIMPIINEDGQVCRTIGEVRLTVDRTTCTDDGHPYATNSVRIGVAIIRPHNGCLPDWAKKCAIAPSPVSGQDAFADQMREPWLWPSSGDISSTAVNWEDELLSDFDHECPLKPGDRLVVVARCDGVPMALNLQFSVEIDIEYEDGHDEH
ncbi:hypothetical protein APHAL10511_000504 [Amanita phalloides]|nr:hypothetical protein APHAL10511_000504 [Amanita phalloides]